MATVTRLDRDRGYNTITEALSQGIVIAYVMMRHYEAALYSCKLSMTGVKAAL